jgi:hypothetical protein
MLPDDIADIIDALIRMWSASDIGLGEIHDRLDDRAARQRVMLDAPGELTRLNNRPYPQETKLGKAAYEGYKLGGKLSNWDDRLPLRNNEINLTELG